MYSYTQNPIIENEILIYFNGYNLVATINKANFPDDEECLEFAEFMVKKLNAKNDKSKQLDRDERQDIGIIITNKLIKMGYVPDCTDTDNSDEFDVQDMIAKVIKKLKLRKGKNYRK